MNTDQMFRLQAISSDSGEVILKLDGWLAGANVGLLQREGAVYLREAKTLILDLEGVRSIDLDGIALLKSWSGERLVLRGSSLFLNTLLKAHGLEL